MVVGCKGAEGLRTGKKRFFPKTGVEVFSVLVISEGLRSTGFTVISGEMHLVQ